MNDLQLGLIGLGGVAVVAVLGYNKWQEYRHRKLAAQLLRGEEKADVLLDDDKPYVARETVAPPPWADEDDLPQDAVRDEPLPVEDSEPVIVAEAPVALRSERQEPSLRVEPVLEPVLKQPVETAREAAEAFDTLPAASAIAFDETQATPVVETRAPAPALPGAAGLSDEEGVPAILVSPAIDYVARFELVDPVPGGLLLDSQQELLGRISKPVSWAGFSERSGQWERVVPEGEYRRLRVGLLLADRRGPLGEADLLTFQGAMQALAEELMAAVDLPPREPALSAAIALDQFCANVDIQIGLNLVSQGQVFQGTKIRALAEAAGMVLDASGRFVRCDDDGYVLYTLENQESVGFSAEAMRTMSTHGIAFMLDVPCVDHGDRVFMQMLDLARRMAEVLHGVLVDDNRRPLTEAMLEPFRRQIGQYQAQLAARGIPAGGPLAVRLFS
jgi:FtsZ-interacting cell division protein ZipA